MTYFEDEFLFIEQEPQSNIAIMKWKGLAKSDDYRNGYNTFLDMLKNKEKKSALWLFDFTNGKVIDIKDQQWTINEWIPSLSEINDFILKRIAIIPSSDVFNKVAARIIMNKLVQISEPDISYFDNTEEAINWLNEATKEEEEESKVLEEELTTTTNVDSLVENKEETTKSE
jgi:hypothetical protein